MILSHKIELKPTKKQKQQLARACGTARFAYNWALARWNDHYKCGLKTTTNQLDKEYNKCKKTLFPWTYEVTAHAGQNAIVKNLKTAFTKFFKKQAGYPKFKKRGVHESFSINNDFNVTKKTVRLPKIGKVKMTEALRFEGKIMSATISKDVDRWFISITVEGDFSLPKAPPKTVGVDLGIKTTVVTSNGEFYDSPKPLKKHLKLLKRRQRQLSKKVKGSNNYKKARLRLGRLHRRIRNIRKDWNHKITSKLASENQVVSLEDLSVSNMMKNHRLSRAISDMSWFEFRRQMEYKTARHGGQVVIIDRFFPSSKKCHACGKINDLTLADRTYSCACGHTCDRDLNAALNINTAGLAEINACGDGSADQSGETTIVKTRTHLEIT